MNDCKVSSRSTTWSNNCTLTTFELKLTHVQGLYLDIKNIESIHKNEHNHALMIAYKYVICSVSCMIMHMCVYA